MTNVFETPFHALQSVSGLSSWPPGAWNCQPRREKPGAVLKTINYLRLDRQIAPGCSNVGVAPSQRSWIEELQIGEVASDEGEVPGLVEASPSQMPAR